MSEFFTGPFLTYGLRILAAVAIIFIGRAVFKIIIQNVRALMQKAHIDDTLIIFANSLLYYVLLIVIIIVALGTAGIPVGPIMTVIGAAILSIGLAWQNSLAHTAAGTMIVLLRPYKVGDFVEIAGAAGYVKSVQIFNTVLRTLDNKTVIIPNGQVLAGNIVNHNTEGAVRIDLIFQISYDDDLTQTKGILLDILHNAEHVLDDPAPTVSVIELGDDTVSLAVRPYVHVDNYWATYFHVTEQVKVRLDEAGMSTPYPRRDVYLFNAN